MEPSFHPLNDVPKTVPYQIQKRTRFFLFAMVLIGFATFLFALKGDSHRAWAAYLVNYFYWFSIALCGLFFISLQYIVSSTWHVPLKRVPESFIAFLPVAFILMLVLFFGMHDLYHHWLEPQDALIQAKTVYLNGGFFAGRNILFYFIWILAGGYLVCNSLKQGEIGGLELHQKNRKLSAPFMVFFALSYTLAAFDWMMSLDPHWFSTIFGVYCFAGLFESGLAMMILFVFRLQKQGAFKGLVNENHIHDLGKLMFAFCVFWAYIAFSQFMLIWYANLPEETVYMIRRTTGDWTGVALFLLFGKFVVPFFLILCRPAKRAAGFLKVVCYWVLAAQWVDIYWLVYPQLEEGTAHPVFGWQEVGLFLGMAGLFILSVTWWLGRVPPVAMKDPALLEGLNHHQ